MYKKKLIKLSTVTLAMSMAFAAPVTAYAEDTQYPSQAETWTNEENASIEYTGDVTTDSDTLSTAYSDNHGTVSVDGNVTNVGNWRAVAALHGSTVAVSGNATGNASTDEHGHDVYTVTAYDGSNVSVGGNVISGGNGVLAHINDSTAYVEGDVTADNGNGALALDEGTIAIVGSVTANNGNGVYAQNDSLVSVEGDVTADNGNGATAFDDGAIAIGGSVTANDGNGVLAERGSSILIGEDVTASKEGTSAYTGSTIVVRNVTAGSIGVVSNAGSETTVTGDVQSGVYGLNSYYDGSITVLGNVDADTGIIIDETSQIAVRGDVNAKNNGIIIDYNNNYKYPRDENNNFVIDGKTYPGGTHDADDNVLIRGKLSVSDDDGTAIVVRNNNDNPYNTNEIIDNLPTIIVYELDAANLSRVEDNSGEVDAEEVSKYIENHIEYVIEKDPASSNYFSIVDGGKIYDYDKDNNNDILTMTIQQAIIVAAAEGYQISGGDNVTVTENEDGTFLVQLANNKGGVTISASLTQIRTVSQAESVVNVSTPVAENSSSSNNSETENETPAAPFIYATFTILNKSNDSSVLGATRDGVNTEVEYSARPVVNVVVDGPLTAIEYKNAFINSIKNAPVNGIVRLETSAVSCIDKQMMESLADRPDVILEITFPVNNEKVTVSIPAGYDVMSLINEDGYCGFLNLLAIFGPVQNN